MKSKTLLLIIPLLFLFLSCEEKETSTPDTTPPTVLITYPANQTTLSATTTVKTDAADDTDIASVTFVVNGNIAYSDTSSEDGSFGIYMYASLGCGYCANSAWNNQSDCESSLHEWSFDTDVSEEECLGLNCARSGATVSYDSTHCEI